MKNDLLILHCSATPEGKYFDKQDIINWHTTPKHLGGRGWSKPGYHDVILLDGTLQSIVPFDSNNFIDNWEIANGAKGYNSRSIHLCYIGGLDQHYKSKDTRTLSQKNTMVIYVRYVILRNPDIKIAGHNQLAAKDCPCFDTANWLKTIGVNKKNIF